MNHKPRVLFFSIDDSTRSQIAEGFLRSFAGDEFVAMSTATRPLKRTHWRGKLCGKRELTYLDSVPKTLRSL